MNEFKVFGCDTDSIIFSRRDGSEITPEQQRAILDRVNALYPSRIRFEDDGYFPTAVVFKAKNYVLYDGKKIKTKGSALKDAKKEAALKEFQSEVIAAIIAGQDNFKEIYEKYVREIINMKDISRWASKKTITDKVMTSPRTNESKVRDVIAGTEYRPGDKVYVFFKGDDSLGLVEKFDGDYNVSKLLGKLHKSTELFKDILPAKELFTKYHLKRAQVELEKFKA